MQSIKQTNEPHNHRKQTIQTMQTQIANKQTNTHVNKHTIHTTKAKTNKRKKRTNEHKQSKNKYRKQTMQSIRVVQTHKQCKQPNNANKQSTTSSILCKQSMRPDNAY